MQTAALVSVWMAARQIQVIQHSPHVPDLALANFFLLSRVKRELTCLTLTQETFKKKWEGAIRNLLTADFTRP
jgi:hypothetical protein